MELKLLGVLIIILKLPSLSSAILTRFRGLEVFTILCAETVSRCNASVPGCWDGATHICGCIWQGHGVY